MNVLNALLCVAFAVAVLVAVVVFVDAHFAIRRLEQANREALIAQAKHRR